MSDIQKIKVGFHPNGDFLPYVSPKAQLLHEKWNPQLRQYDTVPITWVYNFTFKAELELQYYSSGSSTFFYHLKDTSTGKEYIMKFDEFWKVINHPGYANKRIVEEWTFERKGGICGIKLYEP